MVLLCKRRSIVYVGTVGRLKTAGLYPFLNATGIVYEVEEFQQRFNRQCFGQSAQNCVSPSKNVPSVVRTIHTKDAQKKKQNSPNVPTAQGPHAASHKGCPEYKKQALRQHVVNNQKTYAAAVSQKFHPQPKTRQTFQFTAEQLAKFVADVAIQNSPATGVPPQSQTGTCLI